MENAFQRQGWNAEAYEVLSETLILHGTGGRLFCSLPAVKIHFISCTWHATRKSHRFQKSSHVKGSHLLLNTSQVFQGWCCCQKVKSGLVAMHLMSRSECRSSRHYVVSHTVREQQHFAAVLAAIKCTVNTDCIFYVCLAWKIWYLFIFESTNLLFDTHLIKLTSVLYNPLTDIVIKVFTFFFFFLFNLVTVDVGKMFQGRCS